MALSGAGWVDDCGEEEGSSAGVVWVVWVVSADDAALRGCLSRATNCILQLRQTGRVERREGRVTSGGCVCVCVCRADRYLVELGFNGWERGWMGAVGELDAASMLEDRNAGVFSKPA